MTFKIYSSGEEVRGERVAAFLSGEGAGVFETLRAYDGKIFRLEEHLGRLQESAKTVGYQPVPALKELQRALKVSVRQYGAKECFVRLTLWEGQTFVIVGHRAHPHEIYEKGVALKTASFLRGGPNTFPWQAKASAYQQAILASTEPHSEKIYEWLFLDSQGFLTESRIGNFFIVKYPLQRPTREPGMRAGHWKGESGETTLLTPPEHLILNGVTRRFVIKCALEIGIRVRETPLTRHEFFNADEAFLSNTSWEVLPVRELDGRVIGPGQPGPVTLKLHRHFKRRVHQDVTQHRSPRAH